MSKLPIDITVFWDSTEAWWSFSVTYNDCSFDSEHLWQDGIKSIDDAIKEGCKRQNIDSYAHLVRVASDFMSARYSNRQ